MGFFKILKESMDIVREHDKKNKEMLQQEMHEQAVKPETKVEPALEPIQETESKMKQEPKEEPKQEPKPELKPDQKPEPAEANRGGNGLFSARLEAMITAALQDGVLTDKERELLKRRAEKEGEDWDEVEMIIEARLAEMKSTASSPEVEVPVRTSTQQETERAVQSHSQEHKEEENISEDELLDSKQLLPVIKDMLPSMDILEL